MLLSKMASKLDTMGWKRRMRKARHGWPAHSCSGVKFYNSPKVQYRYRESGQGKTIVFAADPPATLELYDELIELYAKTFRVIIVEMPAMGFSTARGNYYFGFHETNDDLACFLRDVAGADSILAFSCVGGLAAVDIAVRYPELVSHLTLIQTTDWIGFQIWKKSRDPKNILAKPFLGQLGMRKLAASRAPMWFNLAVGKRDKVDPFCQCAQETLGHGAGWALASAFQLYIRGDRSPLGKPNQPTLLIWGLLDGSHQPQSITHAKNLSDNIKIITSEEFGHFGELEAPESVFGMITKFLKANP